ncbi:2-amino-4-hydroxy-6-hydroxymethyldihydropteridine diphosphokinase [Candidatus Formimonas warabiya]|uniref:2-amino-4-hydroxy-6-hydroxymethyldihydropteridine diphosphokinase n=1 Tax=Formimonas warabiya TaxID=1761012 RepID=A0A3G1KXW5_FORW1|nr:2-amino-4-hydroxy-6-hydroxymethyldihydropteridine diphosphokinase [Candidatus Formimonas warabiya]ATW27055.1 2-amino-4-hydroxy-6-hydroxymethyldihydropteridine diphosphokinase [Candidatus Formimonas warabiya]
MHANSAYLSLGSNLGDKEAYLKKALVYLDEVPEIRVAQKSSLYQTDPVGYTEQDFFLNAVVRVETTLNPDELLKNTQEIENRLGRKRTIHWGPRTMDIDILLFNEEKVSKPDLVIPHAEMLHRRFVLVPLAELDRQILIPGFGQAGKALEDCPDGERVFLVKTAEQW